MSENKDQSMDPKTAAALGVTGGGGIATLVVSLLMSNMGANSKMMQAENKITIEMVRQNTERIARNEERDARKDEKASDKMDKILDLVQSGTRDRFTKLDQEKHVVKIEARIGRIDDRVLNLSNDLHTLRKTVKEEMRKK